MKLVCNIEKILNNRDKSLYWLANISNISYPTIYNLAKNKNDSIRFDTIVKICSALDCTLNELFTIE